MTGSGDRRVESARIYLGAVRRRKLHSEPRDGLVREAAELRKALGQVLDFITEALAGVVPVATLTTLADQLEERLGDELASRQAIADAALGQLRELAWQAGLPLGATIALPGESALLSAADLAVVLDALADGAALRQERAAWPCPACATHPAGACDVHLDDLDQADIYQVLAARLGGAR